MRILALDIGLRRTGAAFADSDNGIPLPLPTIRHTSFTELADVVHALLAERKIDCVVVGIPFLPSGDAGAQVELVREAVTHFTLPEGVSLEEIDERYTTLRGHEIPDKDAASACEILSSHLSRQSI